jgi:hypothetical protein
MAGGFFSAPQGLAESNARYMKWARGLCLRYGKLKLLIRDFIIAPSMRKNSTTWNGQVKEVLKLPRG